MSIQTDLTPEQMCRAWIANRIKNVDQQTITELMGITNSGRVFEAITVIDFATENADHDLSDGPRRQKRRKE